MIGIDGATVARPQGHPENLVATLPEEFADFESEFVVDWQVADHGDLSETTAEVNSL